MPDQSGIVKVIKPVIVTPFIMLGYRSWTLLVTFTFLDPKQKLCALQLGKIRQLTAKTMHVRTCVLAALTEDRTV